MPPVPAKTLPPVPTKTLPPVQEPRSVEARSVRPIPTLVPSVPLVRVPSGADLDRVNQTVLGLQNAERSRAGKPPLTLDPKLTQAARTQATYCAEHHQLTHTGDNGSSVGDRVTAQGYKWAAVAENAEMQTPQPAGAGGPDLRTAERAVQGWINSPAHKANMLGPYSQSGACYADAPDGTRYWVVTFGMPQNSRRKLEGEAPAEPRPANSAGSAGASPSRGTGSAGASPSRGTPFGTDSKQDQIGIKDHP